MKKFKPCTILIAIFMLISIGLSACKQGDSLPSTSQEERLSPTSTFLQTTESTATPTPTPKPSQTTTQSLPLPEGASVEGFIYSDPEMRMQVMILNKEWGYFKEEQTGQVFFYNYEKQDWENLISISAYEAAGDAQKTMESLWASMTSQYDSMGAVFNEAAQVPVGERIIATAYLYGLDTGTTIISCTFLLWNTEDMVYLCTTSNDHAHSQEVFDALMDILTSFQALE